MPRPLQPEVQMICQKQDEDARMIQLAESIGNHVSASLEMALSRAMLPLTQSLDTFIKCATREQVDGVRRIVGQFIQQMNASLGEQLNELSGVICAVTEDQKENQRNLHNTMAAVQNMTKNADLIRESSAEIAGQITTLSKELQAEQQKRAENVNSAEESSVQLAARIENLCESLRRMQLAVDVLTAELNEPQFAEIEDEQ